MQPDLSHGRGAQQPGADAAAAAEAAAAAAAELRREMCEWKRRMESQLEGVFGELAIVKNCIMELYVLLPGEFPTLGAPPQQPPPPQPQQPSQPPPPPHSLAVPALPPQHPSYQQVVLRVYFIMNCLQPQILWWPVHPAGNLR